MHRTRTKTVLALSLTTALGCGEGEPAPAPEGMPFDGAAQQHADDEPPAALAIPAGAPVVAFLGDSVGAGLHLAVHQSFPAVLQRRLFDEGLPFELVNSCESGRTTAGGRSALEWVLRSEPDLLVLELGANDGLRGIELEEIEANLRAVIEGSHAAEVPVLLLGVLLPTNLAEYGQRFDALYPALAAEYGLAFVPGFMIGVGGEPEMNLEDGMHPTPEGHELLADNVIDGLRAALTSIAH